MDVRKIVQQNIEMDMTPMIDCVFLLMIFFVLVIDLARRPGRSVLPRVFQEPDDKRREPPHHQRAERRGRLQPGGRLRPAVDGKTTARSRNCCATSQGRPRGES
jgi:hypothetical protein